MFRALWIAQFASNVGTWMQTVGAQWLLIDRSPLLVSLVQTASSLPIVVLALPAGAWADVVDRRRLLLGAQGRCSSPRRCWPQRPSSADLARADPRPHLRAGLRVARRGPGLAGHPARSSSSGRCCRRRGAQRAEHEPGPGGGPAIGGFVVAAVGAGWVFVLNAVSFVGIAIVVLSWRAPARTDTGPPERLVEALRSGGRYVRNALIVRRLLYRAVLFIPRVGGVGAAARGRGDAAGARFGRIRPAAGHGRDRRGRRRGGHPAGAGEGRIGPAGHGRDGGHALCLAWSPRSGTSSWSAPRCCPSAGRGSR
jgi:hypothetical protein